MRERINILLVEDQDIAAQMLRLYLKSSRRLRVVDTIRNADLAPVHCARGGVDLVLMDVYTEYGADGLNAAGIIKREYPQIKVIAITAMPEVGYIERARENHVDSFWYKEASAEELIGIIRRTMDGESIYPTKTPQVRLGLAGSGELTKREIGVLRGLVRGEGNQEIADNFCMSLDTVKKHIRNILNKTGFKSRTELAVRARETGLVIETDRRE